MENNVICEKKFQGIDFSQGVLPKGEYDSCIFINCTFSELSNIQFLECEFEDCNLSSANITNTSWKSILFTGCKLIGLNFEKSDDFMMSMSFYNCQLNFSSFYQISLKNTTFDSCNLEKVDFTATNLTGTVFHQCDFKNALIENTILDKADLRSSVNYNIDPEKNSIKKARFSMRGVVGLLNKYDIKIE